MSSPNGPDGNMGYRRELAVARAAAERAGSEIMALYADFQVIPDAPASISTEADVRAQDMILHDLYAAFPDDAFCAEEATPALTAARRQGHRLWIIDPIDGTRGFARKNDEFSIMIALVENELVSVGVVLEPARQRCTFAVRGQGCWKSDAASKEEACRVSRVNQVPDATLVQSRSEKAKLDHGALTPARLILTYSAGIKLALVARGEADFYASTYNRFHAWDVCAGQILVQEAGGIVTDVTGQPIRYAADGAGRIHGVLASNGLVHADALTLLRASGETGL